MKKLIILMLISISSLAIANEEASLNQKIIDMEATILESKDVKVTCSEWIDKLNCLSYLQRFEKEFVFKAGKYGLTKIVLDELETYDIRMNKVARVSVFENFNKQLRKLVPTIYKIDELKTLSRSYSKNYSFKVFCGASLTARQCELGLFNFLKSKPKSLNNGKIKKLIITLEDRKLSNEGSLFMSHVNSNPKAFIKNQTDTRTPANL